VQVKTTGMLWVEGAIEGRFPLFAADEEPTSSDAGVEVNVAAEEASPLTSSRILQSTTSVIAPGLSALLPA
jgi:hypothetical protein